MAELCYTGLSLCNISFKMLYIHWYQLISCKALVFSLLSRTCITASTSGIMTLPVISSHVFFQEVDYFENSTLTLSLRKQGLSSFRYLYKFEAWKMAIVTVIHDFRLLKHCKWDLHSSGTLCGIDWSPMFQDNLLVPSSRIKQSKKHMLYNVSQEWRSHR